MTTSPSGYPAPDDEDDDSIGQEFLNDLRIRLENAGGYGSIPWRTERDAQIHRLASLGWTEQDLAVHYRIGRDTVRAALARHTRDSTPDPIAVGWHAFRVRIPDYAVDVTVDHDTARRLDKLATDHGLAAHVIRSDPSVTFGTS